MSRSMAACSGPSPATPFAHTKTHCAISAKSAIRLRTYSAASLAVWPSVNPRSCPFSCKPTSPSSCSAPQRLNAIARSASACSTWACASAKPASCTSSRALIMVRDALPLPLPLPAPVSGPVAGGDPAGVRQRIICSSRPSVPAGELIRSFVPRAIAGTELLASRFALFPRRSGRAFAGRSSPRQFSRQRWVPAR